MSEGNKYPLVSIIIPTYNSSLYVHDALESARVQTYRDIELIVTDDCSSDTTVEICRKWMDENRNRFVRTEIITSPVNTGIAPNSNRGLFAASGEWIKFIAGDDILLKDCIQNNIEFTLANAASFVFSRHIWFKVNTAGKKCTSSDESMVNQYWNSLIKSFFILDARKQYIKLLKNNNLPASTAFFNKKIMISIGGYDENIPMIEDYPLWIKATKNDFRLFFLDSDTVLYRKHELAVSNSANVSLKYLRNHYLLYKKYRINIYTFFNLIFHFSVHVNYFNQWIYAKSGKRTLFNKILQLFDPCYIKNHFSHKIHLDLILNGPFSENKKFN